MTTADTAPATLLLSDSGKKTLTAEASDRINRGEQVLALDLLFYGDAAPQTPAAFAWTQLLASAGDRPLGLEAAQLIALTRWLQAPRTRLETSGPRTQVVARVAASLEPKLFSEIQTRAGMTSLRHLLDTPIEYQAAPDLFCLDLLKEFDLP